MTRPSRRLRFARALRWLPPVAAPRATALVYGRDHAAQDRARFSMRAATGSTFVGHTDEYNSYDFAKLGYSEEWRLWAVALAVCSRGDVIVEIGANVGTETTGFSDIVGADGRVHAFEPSPSNLTALRGVVAGLRYRNVEVHPMAIGAEQGRVSFWVPPLGKNQGMASLIANPEVGEGEHVEVECRTLDALGEELGHARMITIDVEGAEVQVLRGAWEYLGRHRPVLALEAVSAHLERAGSTLVEVADALRELGLEPYALRRAGIEPIDTSLDLPDANWVALPRDDPALCRRVSRTLAAAAWLPCIPPLSPLTWPRRR